MRAKGLRGTAALLTAAVLTLTALLVSCGGTVSEDGSVIFGKNDFLFPAGMSETGMETETGNYDYIADFQGQAAYTELELNDIYQALSKRNLAFSNENMAYVVAVIPNSQTVYDEYMPASFGTLSDNTRLRQLERFIESKDMNLTFIDLTDALKAAKTEGQLYNNTDNSLNALGAYYAYAEIFNRLPKDVTKRNALNTSLVAKVAASEEAGLALAQQVGSNVKNNSITLTLSEEEAIYSILGSSDKLTSTYIKIGYKDQVPTVPSVLIQYGNASELPAFLPYFSSTFGSVGYQPGYEYSESILSSIYPRAVIQLIREDQLDTLLDHDVNLTYNAGLKPGDDPYTTMTPVLLGNVMISPSTTCLIGTVEVGSVITVSGSTFASYTETAQHDRFFIDIPMERGQSDTVTLTAKLEGKDESLPLEVYVAYNESAPAMTVFAGRNSQLHYPDTLPDYYCSNLYPDNALVRLEKRLMDKLERIREASGKDTKLMFLIPPDCITVYPETATDEMKANKSSDYSRLQQVTDYFANNDDIIIVNLTDIMLANKDKGKLYYQTDTHWTTLGAYFGYYEMMRVIAEDFPEAAPRELSEYNVYQAYESGGDLASFLGVNTGVVTEYKTFCTPNYQNRATIVNQLTGASNYVYSDQIKCVVDNAALPNAIMITDSFGANLLEFITDAFGVLVRETMWDYALDLDVVKDVQPDYYIQVMVERNMGIFGN